MTVGVCEGTVGVVSWVRVREAKGGKRMQATVEVRGVPACSNLLWRLSGWCKHTVAL